MEELPHYAVAWDRAGDHYRDGILREQAKVADAILEQIRAGRAALDRRRSAITTTQSTGGGHPTSAARAVMEALFVTGRLGIARREGNRRYYDLIERLVPARLLTRHESEDEALRHRLLSRYRGVGLLAGQAPGERHHSAPALPPSERAGPPSWSRRAP